MVGQSLYSTGLGCERHTHTQHFGCGLPWELLYADDLVIITESEESLMEKMGKLKEELEMKGLKINVG